MAIVKSIRTSNAGGNLRYILSGPAHNNALTDHRVLLAGGRNIDLDYTNNFDWAYLTQQYRVTRHKTRKYQLHGEDKRTEAQHLIISFSDDEFDCNDLQQQANQGMQLVTNWLKERFGPTAQWTAVAQADGRGQRLHYHVCLNSVNIDGKVLDTRLVKVMGNNGMAENFDKYLSDNFSKVTGRDHVVSTPKAPDTNDIQSSRERNMKINRPDAESWKDKLKQFIKTAIAKAEGLDDFKNILSGAFSVDVSERNQKTGRIVNGQAEKRSAYTYTMTDDDGKQHKSVDFRRLKSGRVRGLGTDFTPDAIQKSIQQRLQNDPEYQAQQVMADLDKQVQATLADLDQMGNDAMKDYEASQAVASSIVADQPSASAVSSAVRSRTTRSMRSMQQRRRNRESMAVASSVVPTQSQLEVLNALKMRVENAEGAFKKSNAEVYRKAYEAVYHPSSANSATSHVQESSSSTSSTESQSTSKKDDGLEF